MLADRGEGASVTARGLHLNLLGMASAAGVRSHIRLGGVVEDIQRLCEQRKGSSQ